MVGVERGSESSVGWRRKKKKKKGGELGESGGEMEKTPNAGGFDPNILFRFTNYTSPTLSRPVRSTPLKYLSISLR